MCILDFIVPTVGTITSAGDACLCYHADNVDLPTTSWPVWLHRTHHQSSSRCISFAHSLPRLPSDLDVLVVRKENDQSHCDFRVRHAVVQQALKWLLENNRYYQANQVQLNEDATSCSNPKKMYNMEPTFQAHLCLMLCSSRQIKRLFVSHSKNNRVDQLALSCSPLLEELLSTNSPQRDILAWPSPPYFQPELQTSLYNAATKSPLETICMEDWNCLMTQTPTSVADLTPLSNALHLYLTIKAVVEHNVAKLQASGQPIATIKAIHTGPNAAKASPDDASGLEAVVCLAKSACVMLTGNLWVEVGLVNEAMGTIEAICYPSGGPPCRFATGCDGQV